MNPSGAQGARFAASSDNKTMQILHFRPQLFSAPLKKDFIKPPFRGREKNDTRYEGTNTNLQDHQELLSFLELWHSVETDRKIFQATTQG